MNSDSVKNYGPIGGVIAVLLTAVIALFPRSSAKLEEKVQTYLDRVDAQTTSERHQNVGSQVRELDEIANDPDFNKLPRSKHDAITDRLAELKAYQVYAASLDKIDAPSHATTGKRLKEVQEQLANVKVPVAYQTEWSQTEAGAKHRRLQEDYLAFERAIVDVELGYRRVTDKAAELRKSSEEPDLPGRAKRLLAQALALPSPETDQDKKIPNSSDVTYASVFAFDRVKAEIQRWEKARELVKQLARLGS